MATTKFLGKLAAEAGTAAGEVTIKSQLDTGVANAMNLANATGVLDPARITDNTIPTTKIASFQTAVDARVQTIVGAAPAALDTLVELGNALGNDASFATTVTNRFTTVEGRVTNIENAGSAPLQLAVPVIASGATGIITHNRARRVIVQVTEVSTGQIVYPVITGNGASSNTVTLDFGTAGAASGAYIAQVI